jgi:Domain of unknown function (DUF4129)
MKPVVLPGDPAHARAIVEAVLSDPEFAGAQPNASLWAKLSSLLESFLTHAANALQALPSWATWLVLVWMTVTLLAIFAHAAYTLLSIGRGGVDRRKAPGEGAESELLGIRDLDFDRVFAEALAARGRRDFPRAIRYGYGAAILWLDQVSWLSFAASKTNRDYVAELRAKPSGAPIFARMTCVFEEVTYGARGATEDLTVELFTDLDKLRHESAQRLAA